MPLRGEKLKIALSTVKKDEKWGYFSSSRFLNLFTKMYLSPMGKELPPISAYMQYIIQDLNNIETITTRLAWQNDLRSKNQLTEGKWMAYAGCDIDLFYIEMRSIFDYLAKVIKRVSEQPTQVPDEGFNALKTWLDKSKENVDRLGEDLAELVYDVNWFDDLKKVRDVNLHQGGTTLVFLEKDRILFQTHKGYENLIYIPEIMYNENVVDFELYAGMHFGYLIAFLEDLATTVEKRLPKGTYSSGIGNPRRIYGELPVIYQWIERLITSKPEPLESKTKDAKT